MLFRRPLVSDDVRDWVLESFEWHQRVFPGPRKLVLPTKDFFSAPGGQDHDTARQVFRGIQRLLDMEDRVIELIPLPEVPDELAHTYQSMGEVAGTYLHDESHPVITYQPKLMRFPVVFINTLAHELMHDKLADHIEEMPGGEPAHELSTDLHCILWGFGVFQMAAYEDLGWAGYMSQKSRAYALDLFLGHHQIDPTTARNHLPPRAFGFLNKARKAKSRSEDLARLT